MAGIYLQSVFNRFISPRKPKVIGYETYLQKAWSDPLRNVTINDVKTAIAETKEMDDEHGAFWVGLFIDEENVLEVHKDLTLFGVFEDAPEVQFKRRAKNWEEVEKLYQLLLDGNIDALKTALNS